MSNLTLDSLLNRLKGQEDSSITKLASESEDKEDKDEKEDKEDKRPKQDEDDSEASSKTTETNPQVSEEMSKSAFEAGRALAAEILMKQANIVPAAQEQLANESRAISQPNPQGDVQAVGAQIVAKMQASGFQHPDATVQEGAQAVHAPVAQPQFDPAQAQVEMDPNEFPQEEVAEEVEKAAAVSALVAEGLDFDHAVSLVKQAEYQLAEEADQIEKMAAVQELMASGYDFSDATELVKQASDDSEEMHPDLIKLAFLAEAMDSGLSFEDGMQLLKEANLVPALQEQLADESRAISHANPQGDVQAVGGQIVAQMQARGFQHPDATLQEGAQAVQAPVLTEQEKVAFVQECVDAGYDVMDAFAELEKVAFAAGARAALSKGTSAVADKVRALSTNPLAIGGAALAAGAGVDRATDSHTAGALAGLAVGGGLGARALAKRVAATRVAGPNMSQLRLK